MDDYLPGTMIELDKKQDISGFLHSLFAAGGLVLSQVLQLTGLNTHTIQNWVKRKYITHPVNKKYDCNQFCAIVIMNMLGSVFHFEDIKRLMDYVGVTDERAPFLIYTMFVEALAEISNEKIDTINEAYEAIERKVKASEAGEEAKRRLERVLKIIILAHFSSVMKLRALERLGALDI